MKNELFPFQKAAVWDLRKKAAWALAAYHNQDQPQILSLQAPTGSGKTVILAALMEEILCGTESPPPGETGFEEQPNAVFVWLSDSPELNRQSRDKIELAADRIGPGRTIEIEESSFDRETLEDGRIYFLNTQKLASPGRLGRPGEARRWTIWETLANTALEKSDRFYFVIDEAHRGAIDSNAGRATTIMQRFLRGWSGQEGAAMPPMPLVIGASATAERFNRLAEGIASTVSKTIVTADDVRASGLLKDRIVIGYPEDASRAGDLSILASAVAEWGRKREHWARYCREQHYRNVDPVLVVQVEAGSADAVSATDLDAVVAKIEEGAGERLCEGEVVHTFGGARTLVLNGLRVPPIEPSRIADDHRVKAVLFKENLSTGWDCPRAETMVSFRVAQDATYIAQLLGRMVRTPLQCRVKVDDSLNEVRLFLPRFNAATVESVVAALRSNECGDIPADTETEAIGAGSWTGGTWTARPARRAPPDNPNQTRIDFGDGTGGGGGDVVAPGGMEPGGDDRALRSQQAPDPVLPPVLSQRTRGGGAPGASGPEQLPLPMEIERDRIVAAINEMEIPTYVVRSRQTTDWIRSLAAISGFLARHGIRADAAAETETEVVETIHAHAEALRAAGRYDDLARRVLELKLSVRVFDALGNPVEVRGQMEMAFASDDDLERQLRAADAKLGGAGFATAYGRRYADADDSTAWKTDVILFASDDDRIAELQRRAKERFRALDDANRRYATSRGEALRGEYDEIVSSSDQVSRHAFRLGAEVAGADDPDGRHYVNHLYVNNEGFASVKLNEWEDGVIEEEERRPDFETWLRNRARAPWALCIPYEDGDGWKAMYPDFLVVRRDPGMSGTGGYVVDILEPHGGQFADGLAKAKGLARYAEQEPRCGRIQLIRKERDDVGSARFLRLDMTLGAVREKVRRARSKEDLDVLFRADGTIESP